MLACTIPARVAFAREWVAVKELIGIGSNVQPEAAFMTGLLFVLVLALLLFGPKETYALAMEAGRYVGMVKHAVRDLQQQFDISTHPEPAPVKSLSAGEEEFYYSPSNATVPGRAVEDISDPQALKEDSSSALDLDIPGEGAAKPI